MSVAYAQYARIFLHHPSVKNRQNTLLNPKLYLSHFQELSGILKLNLLNKPSH